ncbi:MAG: hypothetical protein J0L53_16000 [Spirochaetes bacterium]|nr:hypothetical protein [Spirochaetota bacterium]MBX3720821.1 hypothetical protein [Turneriella sp.]
MQKGRGRFVLKIFGALLLISAAALYWFGRPKNDQTAAAQGEEVYASHDCTDCHLSAPVLAQKRLKKEPGLIRMRRNFDELLQFLGTDKRHASFVMIGAEDRRALVDYLRTLLPAE